MPRVAKVPSYCHHKSTGQARVIINGEHKYLGVYGSAESHQRYEQAIAEWRAKAAVASASSSGRLNPDYRVNELALAYLDWAVGYYVKDGQPTGHVAHVKRAMQCMVRLYGSTRCVDFGPSCLEAIQETLVASGRSRTYINALAGEIRRVFKWGARKELVPVSVYQTLACVPGLKRGRTKAREPEPIGPVDDTTVEATIPHLPPVVVDMVQLQRLTGARPGELCILRPCDVDRGADVWVYTPASHKTEHHGRERRIFIGPRAQEILAPYLLRDHAAYCFSPSESQQQRHEAMRAARKSRVQPSQVSRAKRRPKRSPHDRYTKNSFGRAVARACDAANDAALKAAAERGEEVKAGARLVAKWSPNRLRHAAATEVRKRFGLEGAQVVLGHSKADVTQIYAERDFAAAARIAAAMG